MLKKALFSILSLSMGSFLISSISYGQASGQTTQTTTTSTTLEQQTTQKATRTHKKVSHPKSTTTAVPPASTTTVIQSNTTTTEVKPPPPKEVVHKVYDEEALKKMANTLCTNGFKAFVGATKKNVCSMKATAPDIAYTCVWDKEGNPAFAPTEA